MKHLTVTRRAAMFSAAALPLFGLSARADDAKISPAPSSESWRKSYGLSSFGDLNLAENFPNFPYAEPGAPKGGQLLMEAVANSYDSLNGYILAGNPAIGLSIVNDSLMAGSLDEDNALYGLVARAVEISADKRQYRFHLRPEARFHDGSPMTAQDVVFSLNILREKGHPLIQQLLRDLDKAEAEANDVVLVSLHENFGRDSILNIAGQPILSEAYYKVHDFSRSGMQPPLGSGAYKIGAFEQGRYIAYARVPDYWGKDLPVNVGQNNFDLIRYDYFGERAVGFEAFKAGTVNLHESSTASEWATGYDFPAVRDGRVIKMEIPDRRSPGFQGFFFNLRRPVFKDPRVREALGCCLDFEWDNRNLFYGAYKRTVSYFENTDMKAVGLPSPEELKILEPLRGKVPDEVFGLPFVPPVSDGSGQDRTLLKRAYELLKAAGCKRQGGQLLLPDGAPLAFEFLETTTAFEKVAQPMFKNMQLLGVAPRMRIVDSAQYKQRLDTFDFDMIVDRKMIGGVPGDELLAYFGSKSGKTQGGLNLGGIDDAAVDILVDKALKAQSRAELTVTCCVLDRVLRAGRYWIPNWYSPYRRIAAWNDFGRPKETPKLDLGISSLWWWDAEKAAATKAKG
ncbi:extracellular solute-binding protein [Rhodoblastus acidophilus]|uniref:Extracellular solute-binding protein n=1 Tax=Candidatus Rhodoblastus alkanivorans TaxID=2954117 RepID=A0ABS9Z3R4_9HYPH|nr:extracellular solute-binding protein [Candidatus Rhodoblastus alkanivorans]MCI4679757.1 extracellular solute-binding protein [Candidatus Rhodoblastus alkanivorans]MCI4681995.1 extracellular solute-binding protein [Candidatus Rhodoblastus alkanivorans]MDI4643046.1 extracellular solute-binding protein [Rhodoblastus acidophilus]